MKSISRTLTKCIGTLLVCAMLAPSMAIAKPLTTDKVHQRIARRGLGNWVGVQVTSGAAFVGRIVSIGDDSFGLQLHNDPRITQVQYSDVISLQTGISRKAYWIITAVGFAGVTVIALVAHHEMDNNQQQTHE